MTQTRFDERLERARSGADRSLLSRLRRPKMPPLRHHPGESLAIAVENLGIRYSLRFTRKTTLRKTFSRLASRQGGAKTFWAVRNVSFRLVPGEALAVIGPNGAGKSTLLQALSGIIRPDEGSIEIEGSLSCLLMLGASFDTELTGRENVILAGAFMGIDPKLMDERLEPIIEFADIGEFIDAPMRTYSTGMRARLGFSIATSIDPDILVLDEVLAIGDQAFRAKSLGRIVELVRAAKGIVLVTHDLNWATEYCHRAILLEGGHIIAEGDPAEVVAIHQDRSLRDRASFEAADFVARAGPQPRL